jgi:2-polyprenyl-3-methyl-5-hydroxy-6-metoxy-1,4-benzoquinol methylase
MIPQTVGFARRIAEGVARRLNTLERKVNPALARSSHNESVVRTMNDYDMVTQPDEPFYAQQYLHFILPELERRFPQRRIHLVDLGCGQGRLSLPLARWCAKAGGTVTGVDLTPAAVAKAQSYAAEHGITNATFVARDAVEYAREMADASADAVVFTEVTFFMPSYREVVKELRRVLKPGGIAFIAFRSQYYNMLQLVLIRSWDDAKRCLTERTGHIFGGPVAFAWHTVDDVHRELKEDGLRVLRLLGIGICSGIKGDARATIVHPAQLSPQDQKKLMDLECAAAEQYAACGRYILTFAERA